jgi:putative tricarboxylic transport membrane protein
LSVVGQEQKNLPHLFSRVLARRDVLAGLLFIAVAVLGLWLSRDYPIGTALRMGTGYVPRLLCWLLLGLGAVVLVQGLREAQDIRPLSSGDISAL